MASKLHAALKSQTKRPAPAPKGKSGLLHSQATVGGENGYFEVSRRPLEILFFLLPFIAFYEYELVRALSSPDGLVTNGAHLAILRLIDALGFDALGRQAVALSLPGYLLIAIFMVWQCVTRARWVVDLSVVARMFVESAALALPLLVFGALVARTVPVAAAVDGFESLPLVARIAVSVGAGLYEELLFRMALIAALLGVLCDVLNLERMTATIIAICLSALAFAAYHPLHSAGGVFMPQRFIFFLGAGLYFGILFVSRGFGIAAATHALYDIATALLLGSSTNDGVL